MSWTGTWRRWALAVCVAIFAVPMAAGAQDYPPRGASPQQFLDFIYNHYLGKDSKGVSLEKPQDVKAYFAPPLAAAILRDRANADRRGEVPALDGDPFVDAQDWEIANLSVNVRVSGMSATGNVSFTNAGQTTEIALALINSTAGWRIADIRGPSGSLRKLVKAP